MDINVSVTLELGKTFNGVIAAIPGSARLSDNSASLGAPCTNPEVSASEPVKKAGKTKKAEPEAQAVSEPQAEILPPIPASKTEDISVDQCRDKLMEVTEARDMDVARKILGDFSVLKVSELPQDRRKAFMDACAKAAM